MRDFRSILNPLTRVSNLIPRFRQDEFLFQRQRQGIRHGVRVVFLSARSFESTPKDPRRPTRENRKMGGIVAAIRGEERKPDQWIISKGRTFSKLPKTAAAGAKSLTELLHKKFPCRDRQAWKGPTRKVARKVFVRLRFAVTAHIFTGFSFGLF